MWYPMKKLERNKYWTSDGIAFTQNQIDRKRSEAYRERYQDSLVHWCEGCGAVCQCSAHIIPQARCKVLHKTELIWSPENFFPSCFKCNAAIENPKGNAWKSLRNIDKCLTYIQLHDRELFQKFLNGLCARDAVTYFVNGEFKSVHFFSFTTKL